MAGKADAYDIIVSEYCPGFSHVISSIILAVQRRLKPGGVFICSTHILTLDSGTLSKYLSAADNKYTYTRIFMNPQIAAYRKEIA